MKIGECESRNFTLLFLLLCLIVACHYFFVFLLLCRALYYKAYFVSFSGDRTTYYVDEIWQCLAINVRWSPLVLNNAYYICMEWSYFKTYFFMLLQLM